MDRKIAVVKLGSSSVTRDEGPDPVLFAQTMQGIARVRTAGWQVILVSSGAAALGSVLLNAQRHGDAEAGVRPAPEVSRHLRSAVGQPELMSLYRFLGDACRVDTCQILLSATDLQAPARMERVAILIRESLQLGRLPILNGNDSTDAHVYDNDNLAASVALACRADRLLLLTDVAGVLNGNGENIYDTLSPQDAGKFNVVGRSSAGTGGIQSKVRSACVAALNGVTTTIAQATEPAVIERVLGGEQLGTTFPAHRLRKSSLRTRWIGGIAAATAQVVVNREAEESIVDGASLFGSGVKRLVGTFEPGNIVEIIDPKGGPIGRGSIRVSSDLLGLARAMQPEETVELYLWLLQQAAGSSVPSSGIVVGSSERARRAIAAAQRLTSEQQRTVASEVLTMFPSVAAAAMLGTMEESINEMLLSQTHRFSLIDNRNLVVFRPMSEAAREERRREREPRTFDD